MRRLIVVLLFVGLPAFAVEPLASRALIEQCASDEEASRGTCQAWVHGFIGGAFASRTAKYVDPKRPETFSERAKRTRTSGRGMVYANNVEAGYCLPRETSLAELVEKLNSHAAQMDKVPEQANQLMLGMLRKHYPCTGK